MPAYIVTHATVTNADAYTEYAKLAGPVVQKYGGKFLVRGGKVEKLEGGWSPSRLVVVEFSSVERAKAFYNSPEYQAARQKRIAAADFNMIVAEGATG